MFRDMIEFFEKNFNCKIKSDINFFPSCHNFVFVLYTLISPTLQIILEKIIYAHESQKVELVLKVWKKLAFKSFYKTLFKTHKTQSIF